MVASIKTTRRRRSRRVWAWTGLLAGSFLLFSLSQEMRAQRFEASVRKLIVRTPGARQIGETRAVDPMSPLSWLRPSVTTVTFATPFSQTPRRFILVSVGGGGKSFEVRLVDLDCQARRETAYSPDGPPDAEPARDERGAPVTWSQGRPFVRVARSPDAAELHALCDKRWDFGGGHEAARLKAS